MDSLGATANRLVERLQVDLAGVSAQGESMSNEHDHGDEHEDDEKTGCDHGVVFDEDACRALYADWKQFVEANWPMSSEQYARFGQQFTSEVRQRWPRLWGKCPKGCGFDGIAYASQLHFVMGDW